MNTYVDKGNYYEIIITGNKNDGIILIDKEDYELVSKYTWYIKDDSNNKGYVAGKINGKTTKLHRYLLGVTDRKMIVDHIDRDKLNNRRSNLRITDSSTNNLNTSFSKNNTSGRTGVKYHVQANRAPKWVANITVNGKRKSKSYSVSVYGEKEAYELACKQREKWEEEYNVLTERTVQRLSKPHQ